VTNARVRSTARVAASRTGRAARSGLMTSGPTQVSAPIRCRARTAAIEYAGSGIRINAVAPGAIDTPMLRGAMAARGSREEDVLARLSLIGRFGQPSEIANAVLWLCSDQASYTMGHVLSVDGGYLAR